MTEDHEPNRRRSARQRTQRTDYAYQDGNESDEDEHNHNTSRRKKTTSKQHPQRVQPLAEKMHSALYDGIMDKETSLEELAAGLIDDYEKDEIPALTSMVNFVLKCCGCELPVEQHDVEEFESANEAIAQVQEAAKTHIPADYPLVSKHKDFRGFTKQLCQFFEHLVLNAGSRGILYRQPEFLKRVVEWVTLISASHLRAFRHTATVIVLHMMQVFCQLQQEQIQLKNKQQQIMLRKKVTKAAAQKARDESTNARNNEELLGEFIGDIFTSVFANRFKDIDDKIRTECIESLGVCLEEYPNKFMENTYLKHFVFALNDKATSVRSACLKALKHIYAKVELVTPFRRFTERYQSRMADIAEHDAENAVRRHAVDLLVLIMERDALTDEVAERVTGLIMDRDKQVRQEAAKFMVRRAIDDDYSEEFGDLDEDEIAYFYESCPETKQSYVQFKRLTRDLMRGGREVTGEDDSKPSVVLESLRQNVALVPNRVALAADALLNAARKSGVKWQWDDLINQLTFDFSALDAPEGTRKNRFSRFVSTFEPSEDEKMVAYDMLYGFVTSAMSHAKEPKRGGKRRNLSDIETEITDIQVELIDKVPKLLELARYSPKLTAKALRVASLIDVRVYRSQEREEHQAQAFKSYVKQFTNQTDDDVLFACGKLFSLALDPVESFEEGARNELQTVLDEISYDIRFKLSQDTIDYDALVEPLKKLYHLSFAVDIRDVLETDIVDQDVTLGSRLCETLSSERDEEYLVTCAELLRCYAVWKAGGLATSDNGSIREAENAPQHDRALLQAIVSKLSIVSVFPEITGSEKERKKLVKSQNNPLQTVFKTALLEVLSTVALAVKSSNLNEYGEAVLGLIDTQLAEETVKEIMMIYFEKEEAWAIAAGVTIQENEVDEMVRPINESDNDSIAEDDEDDEEQTRAQNELELDADLCRFTAKIRFASLLGIMPAKYTSRLQFNSKLLSAQYNKVMGAMVVDTNKRKKH